MPRQAKRKRLYITWEMLRDIPACQRGLSRFFDVFGMSANFVWCREVQDILVEIFEAEDVFWFMAHFGLYDFNLGEFVEISNDEIPF